MHALRQDQKTYTLGSQATVYCLQEIHFVTELLRMMSAWSAKERKYEKQPIYFSRVTERNLLQKCF